MFYSNEPVITEILFEKMNWKCDCLQITLESDSRPRPAINTFKSCELMLVVCSRIFLAYAVAAAIVLI